jgi:tetratricopeptide (TPR) repeat protein
LLRDTQVDLTGVEQVWYERTVVKVRTRGGAEQAAHFIVEFDPAYERVDVHFIRVKRDGFWLEHAKAGAFQVFRRESNLERLVLDGRLTASVLIPDVRIDDVVETGFSRYINNQVMDGKYSSWAHFDAIAPWIEVSYRQRRALSRKLSVKSFNDPATPDVLEDGDVEHSCWRAVRQQPLELEEFTPPWTIPGPALQFSEFESWGEVARLFTGLYEGADIPASLIVELDRIASEHSSPQQRAAEWLRFVQRHLRYFALSLGEGGWLPRQLEAIWTSRFGDCKDAARLYVAGARHLGLEACAALISTRFGQVLDGFLPSATIFDHCIVRLRIDDTSYWLDPTAQTQSGELEQIYQPHFGWALPLEAHAWQLESLGDGEALHALESEDVVEFASCKTTPVKLIRQAEYRFWAADWLRNRFADEGTAAYTKEMLQGLQATWPGVRELSPIVSHDDPARNCLTTILSYEIPEAWERSSHGLLSFNIVASDLASQLGSVKGVERTSDIYLGQPRRLTHRVRFLMPRKWKGEDWYRGDETPGLSYFNRTAFDGRTISNHKELLIEKRSISASQAGDYNRTVAALHQNLLTIHAGERFGKIRPPVDWLPIVQMIVSLLMIPVAVMLVNWLGTVFESPSANRYYQRGYEYHSDGQYQRAINELSEAIRLKPNFANALHSRGLAYKNLGDYDRAIFDYDRAIKLQPNVSVYYYNRGNAYYFKNEFDRAIADFSESIRLSPNASALINRGRCHYAVTRFREAIADYDEALKLDPRSELAYFNRATARQRLQEYGPAIADYDAALAISKSAIALFGRGVAKRHNGDIVGGDADIAAANTLDSDIVQLMATLKIIP